MKGLLLTSAGIKNQALANELQGLVGKTPEKTKVGFIPTAAHAQPGNKDWFLGQLDELRAYGYEWIDIVDIAIPNVDWRVRLDVVDVIFVSGGNTFYLLDAIRRSGFDTWLNGSGRNKIYVGASAGSIVMTPSIDVATIPPADDNFLGIDDLSGLDFIDAEVEPHCTGGRYDVIKKWAATNHRRVFAIDDMSALVIAKGGEIQSVGTGIIQEFNYR